MNPFKKARRRECLASEDGQLAIFVALIFQVLFVFFAMVINIGLIIHDKINLQNAVDLGAYYAAQRQAEMLNEIAHINYQIRQDYKLLAWRTRVLGTMGRPGHPMDPTEAATEVPYNDFTATAPSMCIAHPMWLESQQVSATENLCMRRPGPEGQIPQIPPVKVLPFTLPITTQVSRLVDNLRESFKTRCKGAGPINWAFASQMLYAFRISGSIRKQMIRSLSLNLNSEIVPGGFFDQRIKSVLSGVQETIRTNFTQANRNGVVNIEVLNGLPRGPCGQIVNQFPFWLREISIDPVVAYMNFDDSGGNCTPQSTAMMNVPGSNGIPGDGNVINSIDPTGVLRLIATIEGPVGDPKHSSRGFEKNPWCMAYVGVKARTRPRKPFAPFGAPVTLEARAFAQPFGGRIGPWDKTGWPVNGQFSEGPPTDQLAVPRTLPGTGPDRTDMIFLPNYSRFPGDTLGLKSRLAMAAARPSIGRGATPFTLNFYSHFTGLPGHRDTLAWDIRNNTEPPIRSAEIAVVSPDLFDATYYSVDADYYRNYFQLSDTAPLPRFQDVQPISDFGSRMDVPTMRSFTVKDQINQLAQKSPLLPAVFWVIRNPAHLLTGWSPRGAIDFGFPEEDFGRCRTTPAPLGGKDPPTTGDCVNGGRVGYSVRLVHRDYLYFPEHALGGSNPAVGPILNPPPESF